MAEGREGSNSSTLTLLAGCGPSGAAAMSGSPLEVPREPRSAWERGDLRVPYPHPLVPGFLQRVNLSDIKCSPTGGSLKLRAVDGFR